MTCNFHNRNEKPMRLYEDETSVAMVAKRYQLDPRSIIDFSLNVNPFGPPPLATAAAAKALGSSNLYPDIHFSQLRRVLAERHAVDESNLFFGSGLDDVLKLLIHALTTRGDKVLIHIPTFPRYELEASMRGCKVIPVENNTIESINITKMHQMLNEHSITLVFLCTPNNPTGAQIENKEVICLASKYPNTIFVIDEALIYPLKEGAIPLVQNYTNVAVLRTFSKYFGLAGMRIGYAVASSDLLRTAEFGRPPFNLTGPSVEAGVAALEETAFLERCKMIFAQERRWFTVSLKSLTDISVKTGFGNMLLLDLGDRKSGPAAERLASLGVVVADATSFRGLERHNLLRVSLRSREENVILLNALGAVI